MTQTLLLLMQRYEYLQISENYWIIYPVICNFFVSLPRQTDRNP